MKIERADVWCGNDLELRDRMERLGRLVSNAPNLSSVTNDKLRGLVIGGEAPPWSRLPFCAGVIERVPSPKDLTSKPWIAAGNPVEGFASYAIGTKPPILALTSTVGIVAIVSDLSETENATLRAQLGLPPNIPVWPNPKRRQLRGKNIAVAGEVPLAVAMLPDSCTVALPREAGPGQRDIAPFTVTVEWRGLLDA